MANKTLLSQTGTIGPGPTTNFNAANNIRTIQANPQVNVGFSGTLVIEGSNASNPGNNDFFVMATIVMTGHTANYTIDIESSVPWVRANLTASSLGAIAVFGQSKSGAVSGGLGGTPATATVASALKVGVVGTSIKVDAPVQPQFTTDDIIYTLDINKTVTDVLGEKQDVPSGAALTASGDDLNGLTGTSGTFSSADLTKLGLITASASELNFSVGVTSAIQTQIDDLTTAKVIGPGIDLTGLTATVGNLNSITGLLASPAELNILQGATLNTADLNKLTGVGLITGLDSTDFTKLDAITASAADINRISGFVGNSTDLNKFVASTFTSADLDAITGLAGVSVTTTELAFLSGLTENVQVALDLIPPISGLTASSADLNLLNGAAAGTGAFTGASLTSNEIAFLDGLTGNIQSQLGDKRNSADTIGIAEITGAGITTVELNHLSGATSNIQAQITTLSSNAITTAGGTFTGAINVIDGNVAAPGIGFSGSNTTGFYRDGADHIGFAATGVQLAVFRSDNTFIFGPGSATEAPLLRATGISSANPTYTFEGDNDTGMWRNGADSLALVSGGEEMVTADATGNAIVVGGAAASNNAISFTGVVAGEKVLGRATVDAKTLGVTTLYTVPTARSVIITKIYARMVTLTVPGTDPDTLIIDIGVQGGTGVEIVDDTTNNLFFNGWQTAAVGSVLPLGVGDNTFPSISGNYQVLTAAQVLEADVSAIAEATTMTIEFIVFGHEYV